MCHRVVVPSHSLSRKRDTALLAACPRGLLAEIAPKWCIRAREWLKGTKAREERAFVMSAKACVINQAQTE